MTTTKTRTSPGSKGSTRPSAAKVEGRMKPPAEPKDPVLAEIELHLLAFSYNMDSPATDSDGHVWRKLRGVTAPVAGIARPALTGAAFTPSSSGP